LGLQQSLEAGVPALGEAVAGEVGVVGVGGDAGPSTKRFMKLNSAQTDTASCRARSSQPASRTCWASVGVALAGSVVTLPTYRRRVRIGSSMSAFSRSARRLVRRFSSIPNACAVVWWMPWQ
jgi:hypothetical protein